MRAASSRSSSTTPGPWTAQNKNDHQMQSRIKPYRRLLRICCICCRPVKITKHQQRCCFHSSPQAYHGSRKVSQCSLCGDALCSTRHKPVMLPRSTGGCRGLASSHYVLSQCGSVSLAYGKNHLPAPAEAEEAHCRICKCFPATYKSACCLQQSCG